jgi:GMP synthase (glutamine-hydrolysing)
MIKTEQGEYVRALGDHAFPSFISSLDVSLVWEHPDTIIGDADGVILAGAGEFYLDDGRTMDDPARHTAHSINARLTPLIEHVLDEDIPTMGICFGHQLIGNTRGGVVACDASQKKIGTHGVRLDDAGKSDPLLSLLSERFNANYGHHDSITVLPQGATLLATGERCGFSALRYGKHVYTFQFHPELTREDVIGRLKNSPGYLPPDVDPETLVDESPEASTLIPRFAEIVV